MAVAEDVGLVRAVWGAARDNDVDTLVGLTAPDVEWRPTAVVSGALHGHDALRDYLADLAAAGTLVDAHPYSFEALGDCVIVSGALRSGARGQRGDRSALVGLPRDAGEGRARSRATPAATTPTTTRGPAPESRLRGRATPRRRPRRVPRTGRRSDCASDIERSVTKLLQARAIR